MASRPDLIITIRDKLYVAELAVLQAVAKTVEDTVKPEELDRKAALSVIEERLAKSEKDEDDGVAFLTKVLETIVKLLTGRKGTAAKQAVELGTLWKRELKIQGQIGDPKTGVSFLSLVRQIQTATLKGYSETEIVEAIIKAIQPGSNLREYIEGKSNVTLPNLKQILRAHYKEKNATELYHELSNITQGPKEDPTEFLMRALGLRQKVLFASTEKSSGLTYSPELVQGMFRHALYTGFVDETIRHELLPTLEEEEITDEKLIETLNAIYLRERERKGKLGKTAACKTVYSERPEEPEVKQVKQPKEGVFLTELRELKAEILEIRKSMSGSDTKQTKRTGQRGCSECRAANREKDCQHCWRCGSSEHFRRGCRSQGNAQGLQEKGSL